MKLTILGTAASEGWPAAFCRCENCARARSLGGRNIRKRTGLLIDGTIMVDIPPDALSLCQQQGIDLFDLEHLFISHPHTDHLYAPELQWRRRHYSHPDSDRTLHVYGSETTRRQVIAAIEGEWEACRLDFHPVTRWQTFHLNEHGSVIAALAAHSPVLECFNYIIQLNGCTILQGYDTGWYSDETWEHLTPYRFNVVLMDCTNGVLDDSRGHLNIRDLLRVKQKMHYLGIVDDRTAFIATHFSHNGGLLHDDLVKALQPGGVVPAFDGMIVEIKKTDYGVENVVGGRQDDGMMR